MTEQETDCCFVGLGIFVCQDVGSSGTVSSLVIVVVDENNTLVGVDQSETFSPVYQPFQGISATETPAQLAASLKIYLGLGIIR